MRHFFIHNSPLSFSRGKACASAEIPVQVFNLSKFKARRAAESYAETATGSVFTPEFLEKRHW
jgi:hypothetical protein